MHKPKKWKKVFLSCVGTIFLIAIVLWAVGWLAPINKFIPYVITLNRPELRQFRDDLAKGNEWIYVCSPLTAELGLPSDGGDCAFGLQTLSDQAKAGKTVYYEVYSEEERTQNPNLEQVGMYCLHGSEEEKKPYVIMIAGGGFTSVCNLWESLPVCASFNEMGYTCFAIDYRTGTEFGKTPPEEQLMGDVAACVSYITEHADEFNVLTDGYLIGGFSAGGQVASMWANETSGYAKYDLPKPGAVCLIYGLNYSYVYEGYSLPTFSRYCQNDEFFKGTELFTKMQAWLDENNVPNNYKVVEAGHGFGLGSNTDAEGWTKEAEAFWIQVRG